MNDAWKNVPVKYKMDEMETKAYEICWRWIDGVKKYFPDQRKIGMNAIPNVFFDKKDPRKTLLFKYCYKFTRETQNILAEEEIPLYIKAQFDILRHLDRNNIQVEISPNCLVGDKAWKRWKLWKYKYDAIVAKPTEISEAVGPGAIKAVHGFEKTKEFITKTLGDNPTFEQYKEAYEKGQVFAWINFGKISPYYLTISPYLKRLVKSEDIKRLNFDENIYKPCITPEVMIKFKELFPYEREIND